MAVGTKVYGCGGAFSGCSTGFYGDFQNWTLSIGIRTAEYQSFDKQGLIELLPTGYTVTGTAAGAVLYGSGTSAPVPFGTAVATDCSVFNQFDCSFKLTWVSGCYITGSGRITGADYDRPTADVATMSLQFAFGEQPVVTWQTT